MSATIVWGADGLNYDGSFYTTSDQTSDQPIFKYTRENATGIEEIPQHTDDAKGLKIMRDGHIYILRDGKIYSLTGSTSSTFF